MRPSRGRRLGLVAAAVLMMLLVAGCSLKHPVTNDVRGKELFVAKCGACHTLDHAGTAGTRGPNLDDAFREDRANGFKSSAIQGLVSYWIENPNPTGVMPAKLYSGQKAQDVASYVAAVAAIPGHDTGALAQAGVVAGTSPAAGKSVFTGIGGCSSCHTLAAAGATGTVGPNLDTQLKPSCATPASKRIRGATLQKCIHTAIVKPYAYIPPGYKAGIMPANFSQKLKPSEIQALVNFLSTDAK
ncbi:MAG: c-type cytochrome [Solirubrobacteraceae bacterium]